MKPLTKVVTVVGVSLATVALLCTGAAVACDRLLPCDNTVHVSSVQDDPARVVQLFPRLGAVNAAHWQLRDARPRGCVDIGPMDYVYEGLFTIPRDRLAGYPWQPATPQVSPALARYAPAAAHWGTSPAFDRAVVETAASPLFFADVDSGTVYFRYTSG